MSSQTQGIPLRHASEKTGYRLIELPADLEAILESANPPVLTLEPAADESASVLRTPDKAYSLKQKNTSNGLFLLSPQSSTGNNPQQGLATIATIHDTVELELMQTATQNPKLPHTGSKGKWHERFGKNR